MQELGETCCAAVARGSADEIGRCAAAYTFVCLADNAKLSTGEQLSTLSSALLALDQEMWKRGLLCQHCQHFMLQCESMN